MTRLAAWTGLALALASAGSAAEATRVRLEIDPRSPVCGAVRPASAPCAVDIALDARAQGTAENFLWYVDHGLYDGGRFHRTVRMDNQPDKAVKIEVVQAGIDPRREAEERPPIALERTRDTGLRHGDGAVSMARGTPDSATSDFFVCIGDQPSLDFAGARNPDGQGFAAFGQVVSGMEVVRAIQARPADGQSLTPPVVIRRARRLP